MTTDERAIEAFLETLAAERASAANTLSAYQADLSMLMIFLHGRGKTLINAGRSDLSACLAAKRDLSQATQARRLAAFRGFYRFLVEDRKRADNPCHNLDNPRRIAPTPDVMSESDVAAMIGLAQRRYEMAAIGSRASFRAARLWCLVETLYATGLRISELLTLTKVMVAHAPRALSVVGKGGHERMVPLAAATHRTVGCYLDVMKAAAPASIVASPWLFAAHGGRKALSRQRVGQMLPLLALDAGLPPEPATPHGFRHAFATHMLGRGADLRTLQTFLGHADIATTEIYTHVLDRDLIALVETHHPLNNPSRGSGSTDLK